MRQINFIFIVLSIIFTTIAQAKPVELNAIETSLNVSGKDKMVYDIVQPDGTKGYVGYKGEYFDVILHNKTHVPISIHWHGLILPNNQDGIPYVTQLPIKPGESQHYNFKLLQAGTFWMHSHYKFHEQELMSAPLIIHEAKNSSTKVQEAVVMFQGFTFKNPKTILYDLQHSDMSMDMNHMDMDMSAKPDLNDVKFDAYIANRHTLQNPEIIKVKPGLVRLRLINGATATNFWINTGKLNGKAIAVDGNNIQPITGNRFQLAVAQRMDIEVNIPAKGGNFPVFSEVEGTKQRTGFILTTNNADIPKLSADSSQAVPGLNDQQELQLHPLQGLAKKPIDVTLTYKLTGDMNKYVWKINNEVWPMITPLKIKQGQRVAMLFVNDTMMAHPMHFHGHVFQVTEINGKALKNGPLRDTILVMPHTSKKIIFDADNPGIWMMHCHVLYHMASGMMTTTNYVNYPAPDYYQQLIQGKIADEM